MVATEILVRRGLDNVVERSMGTTNRERVKTLIYFLCVVNWQVQQEQDAETQAEQKQKPTQTKGVKT